MDPGAADAWQGALGLGGGLVLAVFNVAVSAGYIHVRSAGSNSLGVSLCPSLHASQSRAQN